MYRKSRVDGNNRYGQLSIARHLTSMAINESGRSLKMFLVQSVYTFFTGPRHHNQWGGMVESSQEFSIR